MEAVKSICAKITDHVHLAGYREIVEGHGKARGLAGFVFNDVDGSVKIMASGSEQAITDFIQDLKLTRPDTIIDTKEIIEEIPLPSPFGRVVTDEMREISDRLDQGVKILAGHTGILTGHTEILTVHTEILTGYTQILTGHTEILTDQSLLLKGINDNLDTLPERIAKALKS